MENLPPNDRGQPQMPPAKPPDRKSQKNEISLAGSPNDSSEDEMPMVQEWLPQMYLRVSHKLDPKSYGKVILQPQ